MLPEPQSILDHIFIFGALPNTVETGTYVPLLVILSYVIASLGSFTGLRLATDIHKAPTRALKSLLHYGGAFAFGAGIWSMHFIGMLAYDMDMAHSYDPALTILSMVIAVVIAYGVLQIIRSEKLKIPQLCGGAVLLGTAICAMHYTGMAAMEMDADLRYIPSLFLLSVLIAIIASGAALWIVFTLGQHEGRWKIVWQSIAALIMGAAICGMHYTGMWASVFIPYADCRYDPDQNFIGLALIIATITSTILGMALSLTIYTREQRIKKRLGHIPFPAKLLSLAIILSLISILWGIWNGYHSHRVLTNDVHASVRTKILTDKIMEQDSMLTYSATMAARTGQMEWEEEYNKHVLILDKTMATIKEEYKGLNLQHVNATDNANQRLIDMETQTFKHVNQHELAEAQNIITSKDYLENKQIYAKGMRAFLQQINGNAHKDFYALARDMYYALYPTIAALVLLIVVWFFALRSVRQWQKELEISRTEAMEAQQKAEESSRAKSEFLANMSHELRTPMNGIIGMTEMLLSSGLDQDQRENAQTLHGSGENLLSILNDILDISKIEAGELEIETVPFHLDTAMRQIIQLFLPLATDRGLELQMNSTEHLPEILMGDLGRIQQVLRNLINNALKFTEKGSITVNVEITSVKSMKMLDISVTDTGIGIPEDKLEHIFEKFTQADASVTRKFGGTGLGLAITQKLVDLMDGEIVVKSTEGKGSIFSFTIPLVIAEKNTIPINLYEDNQEESNTKLSKDMRILAADDHPVNQLFIRKLLNRLGFTHIDLAEDGKEALDLIAQNTYDIVLMDCQMPNIDGYQATMTLRELEQGASAHLPVIALTANAMVGDRAKCLKAGMDDYLSKPIRPNQLIAMLAKYGSHKKGGSSEESNSSYETTPEGDVSEQPPIDIAHFEMFTDGDPEMEKELLDLFFDEADLSISELEQSLANNDSDAWEKTAHRLKGASVNLGANPLSDTCETAEDNYAANQGDKDVMLINIKTKLDELKKHFKS
ncbi:MAG: hypothetical protein COB36_07950 [Alphaproteobacteria bacterium]|nr:MAG: hypothetical protein COB36_07950 [Alphaproteobacteria bacterium]